MDEKKRWENSHLLLRKSPTYSVAQILELLRSTFDGPLGILRRPLAFVFYNRKERINIFVLFLLFSFCSEKNFFNHKEIEKNILNTCLSLISFSRTRSYQKDDTSWINNNIFLDLLKLLLQLYDFIMWLCFVCFLTLSTYIDLHA